ncbi:MAG: alkaline phosphatase family protein [Acidimicrobiales bacterium]
MLRHVTSTSATIWVETDASCTVEILGCESRTFCVEGHHYALIVLEGLAPGSTTPYQVHLDGSRQWPPFDSALPPSVIRTLDGGPLRVLFGSCRTAAPHEPPWSLELAHDPRGRGVDALRAHALRMLGQPIEAWPHLVMLLGDQVYADDSSPGARERMRARRAADPDDLPIDRVADFEEYTWLYHEAWSPEIERWFFSVVPSAMIFDDHDMVDDWNISESWVRDIRRERWWRKHVVGGLVSYWIYQHLGNLSPAEIREEGMLASIAAVDDGGPLLREWAAQSEEFTPVPGGYRFSFYRDLGRVRLVVIDCRNGRVLEKGHRSMLDADEAAWVAAHCRGDFDHLLIATSLPVFVTGALHDLQVWNEAVCDGAWGRPGAWIGERLRRGLDLEDWPAFIRSFDDLGALLADVGSGRSGPAPATISILSGDIHFSYVAAVHFPEHDRVTSHVHQLVSSPIRNALIPRERAAIRFALSRAGKWIARGLRRGARRRHTDLSWEMTHGPVFANVLGGATFDGRKARVVIEQARATDEGEPELTVVIDSQL